MGNLQIINTLQEYKRKRKAALDMASVRERIKKSIDAHLQSLEEGKYELLSVDSQSFIYKLMVGEQTTTFKVNWTLDSGGMFVDFANSIITKKQQMMKNEHEEKLLPPGVGANELMTRDDLDRLQQAADDEELLLPTGFNMTIGRDYQDDLNDDNGVEKLLPTSIKF